MGNSLGGWAFLVGVILAVIFAFVGSFNTIAWLLVLLGVVIGFLNITEKETQRYLMAGTVLVIVGSFAGDIFTSISFLPELFQNLVALFASSTIVVAIKSVFEMARK